MTARLAAVWRSTDGMRLASIVLPKPGDIGPQETDAAGVYYDESYGSCSEG